MRLSEAQEDRMWELEQKQNLNSMEAIELQGLLDFYYDTGECEANKKTSNN